MLLGCLGRSERSEDSNRCIARQVRAADRRGWPRRHSAPARVVLGVFRRRNPCLERRTILRQAADKLQGNNAGPNIKFEVILGIDDPNVADFG
jgi:hypothetical protein